MMVGAETTQARGLLGQRYAAGLFSVTRPGNKMLRAIDDSVFGFGATVNFPTTDRVDTIVAFNRQNFEGGGTDIDTTMLAGGVNVMLSPLDPFCPFVIGRVGFSTADPGDTDAMISLGLGAQYDVAANAALTPSIVYTHVDDYDDVILSIEGNYWFTDRIFGVTGLGVGVDKEDIAFTIGAGVSF